MRMISDFVRIIALLVLLFTVSCSKSQNQEGLKDALKDKLYIGAALNEAQIKGKDTMALRLPSDTLIRLSPKIV